MSLLQKIPTILGAGGGSVPEWRQHLQPCEYLETDGNCYIDTGIKYSSDMNVSFKIYNTNAATNFMLGVYTYQSNWSNYKYSFVAYTNGSSQFRFERTFNNSASTISINSGYSEIVANFTDRYYVLKNFNNTNIATGNFANENYQTYGNIYLFAANRCDENGDNVELRYAKNLKLYNYVIDNIINMIPCYVIDEYTDNKGNVCGSGVAGMVDTLTGVFYTNDGTGVFSHGADINI